MISIQDCKLIIYTDTGGGIPAGSHFKSYICSGAAGRTARAGGLHLRNLFDNLPHQTVFLRLAGVHPEVAVGVPLDLLQRLAGLPGKGLVQAAAHLEDLFGLNGQILRRAHDPAQRLVQQVAGVGQRVAVLLRRRGVNQGPRAGHPAGADHLDGRLDEADHVENRVPRFHMPALRVDDDLDVIIRNTGQEQQLLGDLFGQAHVDLAEDQNGAGFEQPLLQVRR